MITIIKPGKRRTATCPKCDCIFSYEKEDIEQGGNTEQTYYEVVTCPCCSYKVKVEGAIR